MNRLFRPIYHLFLILVLFTISFCIGISQIAPIYAATGINQVINFQGKVVNSDGTNVTDGTYDFVFKLYDGANSGATNTFTESWTSAALFSSTMSSAPGAAGESLTYSSNTNESTLKVGQILWNTTKGEAVIITSVNTGTNVLGISPTAQAWAGSDTITNKIYVKDGVFHVNINSLNQDLSAVDFNTDNIFVGLNFNANGEMKPRIQFTSTPYAMNARKVSGLTVTDTTGTFTLANSKTFSVNNTLTLSGTDGTGFTFPSASGLVVTTDSTATLTNKTIGSTGLVFSGASTDITTGTNENLAIMPNGTGNVGIGTTSPGAKLHVAGNGTYSALFTSGNVGIGTTAPGYALEVSGDIKIGDSGSTVPRLILGSSSADGTGANGAMIYNTSTNKFRCYENGGWTDCIGTAGTTLSFTNGLTSSANTVSLGGTLTGNTTLSDGGFNLLFSGSTGRMGIGTTSPAAKLHVAGNNTTSAVFMSGNVGIGTTLPGSLFELVDAGTTTNSFNLTANSLTTGIALNMNLNSLTSGKGLYIGSTSTGLTTGNLFNLDWSPTSTTNATGDLAVIGIGSSGNIGNIFNIKDSGSSLFSVSESQVTSNLPASFNAAGDTSFAYDISLTNEVASYIKSNGPMYIQAGDSYESNDLTLRTYNAGNVAIDLTGTGSAVQITGTDTSMVFDTRTAGDTDYWMGVQDDAGGDNDDLFVIGSGSTPGSSPFVSINTNGNVGIGNTSPSYLLSVGSTSQFGVNSSGAVAAATGITSSGTITFSNVASGLVKSTSGVLSAASAGTDYMAVTSFSNGLTTTGNTITLGGTLTGNTTFSDAGFNLLFSGSTGKVGIGTTSPGAKLHVAGNNTTSAVFMSGNVGINTTAPSYLFAVGSTSQFGINGSGAVAAATGITSSGTITFSNVASGLVKSTSGVLSAASAGTDYMAVTSFSNGLTTTGNTITLGGTLTGNTTFSDAGFNLLFSGSTGRMGIGTTSPGAKLHVLGNGTYSALFTSGNVGIGTTAPGYALEVSGDIKIGDSGATVPRLILGSSGADGTGVNGAMIYNTATNKFRCYQNSGWTDCIGTGGPGTSYSFTNGLTSSSSTVTLGGALTANTTLSDGGFNLNFAGGAGKMGIGTTSPAAKLHVAGNNTTSAVFMSGNVGIGTTLPGSLFELVDAGTTTNSFNLTANSLTTGTALNMNLNSLTSGKGLYIGSTSTALTTGNLLNLDWSPNATTNATGDLVVIGIGSSGNIGNIFNIKDSGNSLFSVSETQITSALPHAFTAAGDVSVAYDMLFTNQTASYIKSNGSLYVTSGDTFESNDLTLRTYNAGNVVVDLTGTGQLQVSGDLKIGDSGTTIKRFILGSTSTDGTGTNGAMVYNTATNKFRCYENSGWTDCIGSGSGSPSGVDGAIQYNNGGSFGGASYLFYNDTSNQLGIGTTNPGYMLEVTGAVGIGTSNNTKTIDIGTGTGADTINIGTGATTGDVISIGTGNSTTRVMFYSNSGVPTTSAWASGNYAQGAITTTATSGRIWIKAGSTNYTFKSTSANAADYSEFMMQEKSGQSEPGDLIMISSLGNGRVKPADLPYTSLIVGAVTTSDRGTSYNDLEYDNFSGTGSRKDDPAWTNVGMMGQVYVKVSTANGSIKAGDPITTSDQPGIGMKATKSGRVVGFALQPWTGTEKRDDRAPQQKLKDDIGMILVLIQPTWLDNDNTLNLNDISLNGMIAYPNSKVDSVSEKSLLQQKKNMFSLSDLLGNTVSQTAAFADAIVANMKVGILKAMRIETDSIKSTQAEIVDAEIERLNSQVVTIKNLTAEGLTIEKGGIENIKFDGEGNAVFKGTIVADKIIANHIEGLEILQGKIASLEGILSSKSIVEATLEATASAQPVATSEAILSDSEVLSASTSALLAELEQLKLDSEPKIATDIATLSGLTIEHDATVSGTLSVNGSSVITGILNVIDTITTNNFIVSGWARFTGSTVFHGDTYFSGRPTFNRDTAGIAIVKKNTASITVKFSKEYTEEPIVTANITRGTKENDVLEDAILNGEIRYIITNKSISGFTIKLNKKVSADLEFSWIALASKDLYSVLEDIKPSVLTPTPLPIDSTEPQENSSPSAARINKQIEQKL